MLTRAVLLAPPGSRGDGPTGGAGLAELITGLEVERIEANLDRVREDIAGTGRDPAEVEILAATKYVASEELPVLARAGVSLVGENRAQDLVAKAGAHPGLFTWDFI